MLDYHWNIITCSHMLFNPIYYYFPYSVEIHSTNIPLILVTSKMTEHLDTNTLHLVRSLHTVLKLFQIIF